MSLKYVKEQTEDICLEALKDNVEAIKYVNQYLLSHLIDKKLIQINVQYADI